MSETKKITNQQIAIYIILFIIVLLFIWFIFRQGKKQGSPPKVKYPHGTANLPIGFSGKPLATELKSVMNGFFTLSGTKDETWQKLVNLPTDDMVRSVYDVFNQEYFSLGKGTLTKWIEDEYWYDPVTNVKGKALDRLASLELQ